MSLPFLYVKEECRTERKLGYICRKCSVAIAAISLVRGHVVNMKEKKDCQRNGVKELAVGSGAVNTSEPRENSLFDCVVDPSPKSSERGDLF